MPTWIQLALIRLLVNFQQKVFNIENYNQFSSRDFPVSTTRFTDDIQAVWQTIKYKRDACV